MKKLKPYLVFKHYNLAQALKIMRKNSQRCCVVVDNDYRLLGTLSEGDARKAVSKKSNLKKNIMNFCNRNSKYFTDGNYNYSEVKKVFFKKRYDLIPVLDKNKIVKKILLWHLFFASKKKRYKKLNIKAVIMAGGKGTRLNPLTKILPKSLVPIKDKPIIEHIISRFTKYGINDFYFTIRYKMEIIKAYFNDTKSNSKIKYLEEKNPLGTAGGLKKLYGKIKSSFFVTNCDVLIDANFVDFFNFHKKEKSDISLVIVSQKYTIPYGVCKTNNRKLEKIIEKPKFNYFVSAGLYLINPKVLKLIPKNKYFDMNDLIKKAIERNYKVNVYPIAQKNWIDIGQLAEYKKHLKSI